MVLPPIGPRPLTVPQGRSGTQDTLSSHAGPVVQATLPRPFEKEARGCTGAARRTSAWSD
eukprot:5857150-Pyramimonas_sp.AAC.1